jgi:nicotinamidase-related amidase
MASPATGPRNNPGAEDNIAELLAAWRRHNRPIVHVRHLSTMVGSPFWPGQSGVDFQARFLPREHEHVVDKDIPDALLKTGLVDWLRERNIGAMVIVGVSTNNSVESTARTAGNLGFAATVVADATFAFDKTDYAGTSRTAAEVHAMSLANLDGEYAAIAATAELL